MPALPSALRAAGLHLVQQSRTARRRSARPLTSPGSSTAAAPPGCRANVFSAGDVAIAVGGDRSVALAATGALRIPAVTLGRRRTA
jgi:hypothetical protein